MLAAVARSAAAPCTESSAEMYFIPLVDGATGASATVATCTCETYWTKLSWINPIMASNMSKPSRCHSASGSFWPMARRLMPSRQVVHLVEVLAPVLVDHRQHHAAFDLAEVVGADRLLLRLVQIQRVVDEELDELVAVR